MSDRTPAPSPKNATTRRAVELDALSAILPMDRRDRLAEILTDDDVATLKHLAKEGMGENSLRALASDLAYLEAWALAATGSPLPWPAPEALALKFVAHHLWDPARREADPSHGMPADVAAALRAQDLLRRDGPHAPATVRRRLSSWSTLHHWRGVAGPFASPALRSALRLAVRASVASAGAEEPARGDARRARRGCSRPARSDRLVDTRDAALLLVAFASGGRRRSEVGRAADRAAGRGAGRAGEPSGPASPRCRACRSGLAAPRPTGADEDARVLLVGRRVEALREWLVRADIAKGPVFRAIDQWGGLDDKALTPQSVNSILKRRLRDGRARSASIIRRTGCAPAI